MALQVAWLARAALVTTFVVAVVGKTHSRAAWRRFTSTVDTLAPGAPPQLLGVLTVASEVACAVLLLAWPVAGLVAASVVMAAFTVAMVRLRTLAGRPGCNCFGIGGGTSTRWHVARNVALLALALVGVAATLDGSGQPELEESDLAGPIAAGVILGLVAPLAELAHHLVNPPAPVQTSLSNRTGER